MERVELQNNSNILFIPDLHLRSKGFTTIANYTDALQLFMKKYLPEAIEKYNVTNLVFLGDVVDSGLTDTTSFMKVYKDIESMVELVPGDCYLNIGNHMFLDLANNPEMWCIQPHQFIRPMKVVDIKEQLIKTPKRIRCGNAQITLNHYYPKGYPKDYNTVKEDDVALHIACWHDDELIPLNGRATPMIDNGYRGININICGHIHIPHEPFTLPLSNGEKTLVYIPGSIGRTSSKKEEENLLARLPLLIVDNDGNSKCVDISVNTGQHLLKISEKEEVTEEKLTFKEIKEDLKENIVQVTTDTTAVSDEDYTADLGSYIRKYVTDPEKLKIIQDLITGPVQL